MKKIMMCAAFIAAMGLFTTVNAQEKAKKCTKTEQCEKKCDQAKKDKCCKAEGCTKADCKKTDCKDCKKDCKKACTKADKKKTK